MTRETGPGGGARASARAGRLRRRTHLRAFGPAAAVADAVGRRRKCLSPNASPETDRAPVRAPARRTVELDVMQGVTAPPLSGALWTDSPIGMRSEIRVLV
ncbi:MAG: hypothetical protein O9972_41050 [Burkholderiales bacterium]|nr:hypothetical protein [Burkholderiales bacterium]